MFAVSLTLVTAAPARATYSIVACDVVTKDCGAAVQTDNLAVGASVPYAQYGVGAIASQFETNPSFGAKGLAMLARAVSAEDVLKTLIADDNGFDGMGPADRQVGVVGVSGSGAAYTGTHALESPWAGSLTGPNYSIQGNGLVGLQVVQAMQRAFLASPTEPLGDRLLSALVAGDATGGQSVGRQSAALLVRTRDGFPFDVDLRVDSSPDPVRDLVGLYNMQLSRQELIDAQHMAGRGQFSKARAAMLKAVARAPSWPRTLLSAAKVAVAIDEPHLALQYLMLAFSNNRNWAYQEIGSGDYYLLGSNAQFGALVPNEVRQTVLSDFERPNQQPLGPDEALSLAKRLLEVSLPSQAQLLLMRLPHNAKVDILLALAYLQQRDFKNARAWAEAAIQEAPSDALIRSEASSIQNH